VRGVKVDPNQGYGSMAQGKLYRFCSRNYQDKFGQDPDSYLKNGGDE